MKILSGFFCAVFLYISSAFLLLSAADIPPQESVQEWARHVRLLSENYKEAQRSCDIFLRRALIANGAMVSGWLVLLVALAAKDSFQVTREEERGMYASISLPVLSLVGTGATHMLKKIEILRWKKMGDEFRAELRESGQENAVLVELARMQLPQIVTVDDSNV